MKDEISSNGTKHYFPKNFRSPIVYYVCSRCPEIQNIKKQFYCYKHIDEFIALMWKIMLALVKYVFNIIFSILEYEKKIYRKPNTRFILSTRSALSRVQNLFQRGFIFYTFTLHLKLIVTQLHLRYLDQCLGEISRKRRGIILNFPLSINLIVLTQVCFIQHKTP